MRKIFKIYLCTPLMVFLFSKPANSTEFKKEVEGLQSAVTSAQRHYGQFVKEVYEGLIASYFSFVLVEHRDAVVISENHIKAIKKNVDTIREISEHIIQSIDYDKGSIHRNMIFFASLGSSLDKAKDDIHTNIQDLKTLIASLKTGCNDEKLKSLITLYDPTYLFPSGVLPAFSVPHTPLSFGLSIDSNLLTPTPVITPDLELSKQLGALGANYGNQIGGRAGEMVGTLAGQFLPLIINIIFPNEEVKLMEQYQKLAQTLKELQENTAQTQKLGAFSLAKKLCDESIPNGLVLWAQKGIEDGEAALKDLDDMIPTHKEAAHKLRNDYFEYLDDLDKNYFPDVNREYLNILQSTFENRKRIDREAIDFLEASIQPVCLRWTQAKKISYEEQLDTKQELWSKLIDGEIEFNQGGDLSLGQNVYQKRSMPTLWDHIYNGVIRSYLGQDLR